MTGPHRGGRHRQHVDLGAYQAWLFDLDGVLTRAAEVHARAWKQAFDEFLDREAAGSGKRLAPFDPVEDYERCVDGQPRADGVRNFLAVRHIELPEGADDDPPDARTVAGVGNRTNGLFRRLLETTGVGVYDGAISLVRVLRGNGVSTAVVSASENTRTTLAAAGITELFDPCVDGPVVKDRRLAGKPAPDSYLEGARVLGAEPGQSVVVEDALAGVEAGRTGRFGPVVGVDHHDHGEDLRAHGADVVVTDLAQLLAGPGSG